MNHLFLKSGLAVSHWLLICLSFGFSLSMYGQEQAAIDSMKRVAAESPRTRKLVATYTALAEALRRTEIQQSLHYAQMAQHLGDSLHDYDGKAGAEYYMGRAYMLLGAYEPSVKSLKAALEHWEKVGNIEEIARCSNVLGYLYDTMGQYEKALENYRVAESSYMVIEHDRPVMITRHNIATTLMNSGEQDSALVYFKRNLPILAEKGYLDLHLLTCNNIGYYYHNQKEPDSALFYLETARKLADPPEFVYYLNSVNRNLGEVMMQMGEFAKADSLFHLNLKMMEDMGELQGQFEVQELFYKLYRAQGPGISPEDQQKMFGKFQKLSAQPTAGESSTGLGLSIVKSLAERLHLDIEVDSVLGQGTTFRLVQQADVPVS